jgi:hypothetical protein
MRIYLQAPPSGGTSPKYCHLILQQDLLGSWTLLRETGQPGGRAALKREVYLDLDTAQAALLAARDQQTRKGLRVMFVEGAEPPPAGA